MNIFYEDSGSLKVAVVVQKNDATYLADTQHGKRVKIKASNVFLTFDDEMNTFLDAAQNEAAQIDTALLWDTVGEEEFAAKHAATEYFGINPSSIQLAATLIALYAAPMYFHKKNKGIFKAASKEVLQQALAAIERKAQQEAQIEQWVNTMLSGCLPEPIAAQLPKILHAPDKQSLAYKAFIKAAEMQNMSPYELAKHTGGIRSLPEYLQQRFELKNFPNGTGFANITAPTLPENLPLAKVAAFSIDDEWTTEIDDALSVVDLGNNIKRIGIHIAAPSLSVAPQSDIENLILTRQSTAYFPGGKITMLPENWITTFSLDEGKTVPAFSIYFDVDAQFNVSEPTSCVELVSIKRNLTIQQIEPFFNSQTGVGNKEQPQFAHHADLLFLLDLAHALQRKRNRLNDETQPKRYDYSIDLKENKVQIIRRERGSPIDTLVSEMMILANSSWAKMLHDNQTTGIFRVQPSGRVRMSTHSEPHIGMNLAHYGWFTSPLRRASDFINQKQLYSVLNPECPPRFLPKDSHLFAALGAFESTYAAYSDFQTQMEYYWSLVYLLQENIREINGFILKEDLVRLEGVPISAKVSGIPIEMAPKSWIKLAISEINPEQQFIALKYLNVIPHSTIEETN